jgi:hypothetical protein
MFSYTSSAKMGWLHKNPAASLVVANHIGEEEA